MVPKGCERVSPLVESVLFPNKTEADELVAVSERSLMKFPSRRMREGAPGRTGSSPDCQILPQKNSGTRRSPREKAVTLAEHSPGAAEGSPSVQQLAARVKCTKVSEVANRLSEDIYDHLLREAGDFTNPGELYELRHSSASPRPNSGLNLHRKK